MKKRRWTNQKEEKKSLGIATIKNWLEEEMNMASKNWSKKRDELNQVWQATKGGDDLN
jgi:hypothetical protein